jgi:hypothetical protein
VIDCQHLRELLQFGFLSWPSVARRVHFLAAIFGGLLDEGNVVDGLAPAPPVASDGGASTRAT